MMLTARLATGLPPIPMTKLLAIFVCRFVGCLNFLRSETLPARDHVVLPVEDQNLAGEACWSDPNIVGVNLRTAWMFYGARSGDL